MTWTLSLVGVNIKQSITPNVSMGAKHRKHSPDVSYHDDDDDQVGN
jgi:hypothetical protein